MTSLKDDKLLLMAYTEVEEKKERERKIIRDPNTHITKNNKSEFLTINNYLSFFKPVPS